MGRPESSTMAQPLGHTADTPAATWTMAPAGTTKHTPATTPVVTQLTTRAVIPPPVGTLAETLMTVATSVDESTQMSRQRLPRRALPIVTAETTLAARKGQGGWVRGRIGGGERTVSTNAHAGRNTCLRGSGTMRRRGPARPAIRINTAPAAASAAPSGMASRQATFQSTWQVFTSLAPS